MRVVKLSPLSLWFDTIPHFENLHISKLYIKFLLQPHRELNPCLLRRPAVE